MQFDVGHQCQDASENAAVLDRPPSFGIWGGLNQAFRMIRRRILLLLTIVAAISAALAWLNRPHDDPARTTVEDAVRSFRAHGTGPNEPGAAAPGVYRYATRGSESVETAILSATHDYNGVSTIAITPGGCGEIERWQVLVSRWNEIESCGGPKDDKVWTVTEFHEFFDVGQEAIFRCGGTSTLGPPFEPSGTRFSSRCDSGDSSATSASRVVGFEVITVDGRRYEAIHTMSRSVLSGDTEGSAKSEDWRRRSDGLLLRRWVSSDASTSDGGGTHYTERYMVNLIDPKPQR